MGTVGLKIGRGKGDSFMTTKIQQPIVERIIEKLHNPPDLVHRSMSLSNNQEVDFVYIQSLADEKRIESNLMVYIAEWTGDEGRFHADHLIRQLRDRMPAGDVSLSADFDQCIQSLLEGKCLLVSSALTEVLAVDAANPSHRNVSGPKSESTVRGPQEAFTEELNVNLSLLRKRIKVAGLRVESEEIGQNTKTRVVWLYMDQLAPSHLVEELRKRISAIQIDSVLDSSYIEEWIKDHGFTPFPPY